MDIKTIRERKREREADRRNALIELRWIERERRRDAQRCRACRQDAMCCSCDPLDCFIME